MLQQLLNGGSAGGIAGYAYNISIENCCNNGKITGHLAGGIVSQGSYMKISKSYNSGEIISAGSDAGGIYSWTNDGELIVEDCYNTGKIVGPQITNTGTGGIAGGVGGGTVKNCYNIGPLSGMRKGEITGYTYASIIKSYFLNNTGNDAVGEILDSNVTVDVTAKTTEEMKTQEFVDLLNNGRTGSEAVWKMDTKNINNGYPILAWQ